jgi:hypothetical protein
MRGGAVEKIVPMPVPDELEDALSNDDEFLFEVAKEPQSEQEAYIALATKRCYCYCHCTR